MGEELKPNKLTQAFVNLNLLQSTCTFVIQNRRFSDVYMSHNMHNNVKLP